MGHDYQAVVPEGLSKYGDAPGLYLHQINSHKQQMLAFVAKNSICNISTHMKSIYIVITAPFLDY